MKQKITVVFLLIMSLTVVFAQDDMVANIDITSVESLTSAIERTPDNAEYYAYRADVYYKLKKFEEAFSDLNSAISLQPQNARFYAARSAMHRAVNSYSEAMRDCNTAIRLAPDSKDGYYIRGSVYMGLEYYWLATEDFSKVIELARGNEDADFLMKVYIHRGESYWNMDAYEKAYQDFGTAIELKPRDPRYLVVAYSRRSECAVFQRKMNEAIENSNKVLELNPQYIKSYLVRAIAYSGVGRYGEAIADCNAYLNFDQAEALVFYTRAVAFNKQKKYRESLSDYNEAIRLEPTNTSFYEGRSSVYWSLGWQEDDTMKRAAYFKNALDDTATAEKLKARR
jgi:tetratricopeptide (TPR) repeat protein